jgi:hypothetical protein
MRNSNAYPIWPAAPVTATRTGFLLMAISEEKFKIKRYKNAGVNFKTYVL